MFEAPGEHGPQFPDGGPSQIRGADLDHRRDGES